MINNSVIDNDSNLEVHYDLDNNKETTQPKMKFINKKEENSEISANNIDNLKAENKTKVQNTVKEHLKLWKLWIEILLKKIRG